MTTPFSYLPHTASDRLDMLKVIGVQSFEELLTHIPESVRTKQLKLPDGLSELELCRQLNELASKNRPATSQCSFLGGGSYQRYVPAAVPAMVSRSEFATSYTPYQPEVSQGTLQAIYEFQSVVCLLTGMEIANASVYDGPTAAAEAALMAARLTGRNKIVVPASLNPEYRAVVGTYAKYCRLELTFVSTPGGVISPVPGGPSGKPGSDSSTLHVDSSTAALIIQYPNYFGCFEDLPQLADIVHSHGAKLIVVCDPIALGMLEAPGRLGADIVVGDAQPCGNYLSFGGPSAGFMATHKENMRQLPGRIAGITVDNRRQRAFTLTLQTREQHIRRANATSNICTNQALNALTMLVYLALMGPEGLSQLCRISVARAHYLADKLTSIAGISLLFNQPFFNEFAVSVNGSAQKYLKELEKQGVLGGIALKPFYGEFENGVLVCVTEMNSIADIDKCATAASTIMSNVSNLANPAKLGNPAPPAHDNKKLDSPNTSRTNTVRGIASLADCPDIQKAPVL